MYPDAFRWLRYWSLIGSLLLVLSACSTGNDDDADIRSIDDILVGQIGIVDISGNSARLEVETSIPVACSVVYGPDGSYGQQSTDMDMAGGGHSIHNPLLGNLEPETVYHYRLVGTGPDGTIYRSEDMTFETSAARVPEDLPPQGRNAASAQDGAQIIEVSSEFGETWVAANAIDDDPSTEWSSAEDGDNAFITVELAEPTELVEVGIWTRTMGGTAQIESFQVVTGSGTVLGPFEVPDAGTLHTFPVDVTAETLRFEVVNSSGGNTGLVELVAIAAE